VTDVMFACDAELARRAMSKYTIVYGYEFTEPDPVQEEPLPAITELPNAPYHTSEEAYVFNGNQEHAALTGRAAHLSALIRGYWTAFARTGDPNGRDGIRWPPYRRDTSIIWALQSRPYGEHDFFARHNCARLQASRLIGWSGR